MSGVPAPPTAAEAIASAEAVSDLLDEAMPPALPANTAPDAPEAAGGAGGPSGGAAAAGGAAPAAGPAPARPPGPSQQGEGGQARVETRLRRDELQRMRQELKGRKLVVNGLTSIPGLTDGPNPRLKHTTNTSFLDDKFHKDSRRRARHTCLDGTQRWICTLWLDLTTHAELFSGRPVNGDKAAVAMGAFKENRTDGDGPTVLLARCNDGELRKVNPRIHRDKDPCEMSFPTTDLDADMQRLVNEAKEEDDSNSDEEYWVTTTALHDALGRQLPKAFLRRALKSASGSCAKRVKTGHDAQRGPDHDANADPPLEVFVANVWESLGPLRDPVARVVQAFFPAVAPQRVPVSTLGQVLNALCLDSVSAAVSVLASPPRADSSSSDDDSEEEGAAGAEAAGAEADHEDDRLYNAVVAVMAMLGINDD